MDSQRLRTRYFTARFTLDANDIDFDLNDNFGLFKSENPGSANFDADRGHYAGFRPNIRVVATSKPVWIRYNNTDNDPIYVAADIPFEDFNMEVNNIFMTSADDGGTAQIDRVVYANDVSGNYNNTYFKLYAVNGVTNAETVYGVWYNINSAGVQPTDAEVDTWLPVAAATNATAAQLGAATELVIDAVTGVFTSDDTVAGTLNITHVDKGPRRAAVDVGTPATVSTPTAGAGSDTVVSVYVR